MARSRSSRMAWRVARWFSASFAAADTRASVLGWNVRTGPVRSTAPTASPVSGSWIGAAAQVNRWYCATRCSEEWICTAESEARVVPIALVPAESSLQRKPSASSRSSAMCSIPAAPSRQRMWPWASVTIMTCIASSAISSSVVRRMGSTWASGCDSRTASSSRSSKTRAGAPWSGSTCAASERRQESETTSRCAISPLPPESTASRTRASNAARSIGSPQMSASAPVPCRPLVIHHLVESSRSPIVLRGCY